MIEISSGELTLVLDSENPLIISEVIHAASGKVVSRNSRQILLVRFPRELSDPVFATDVKSVEQIEGGVRFQVADDEQRVNISCEIVSMADGIRWDAQLTASEPVWMLEWRVGRLDLSRLIVPALGGQYLGSDMPADTQVTYKYPFWWNAQFGIGEIEGGGGIWLRTLDTEPVFKLLRVGKVHDGRDYFSLGLGIEADAPLEKNEIAASWYLDGFSESWIEPVDKHRAWLESARRLVPYRDHGHYPDWVDEIDFILEIWGASKERPDPLHTFDEIAERIREFAAHHPPSRTLLYLPGFANKGIDSEAPDYTPSSQLGGVERFGALIDEAHELGYRVMLHTNVLALAYTHPEFSRFEKMQVVDAFGRKQGWGNDIDGDWLHEPFFAYVNPGFPEWGDLMEGVIGMLVERFGADAVFLAQTLLAFTVSRGPNFIHGMRQHVERLQKRFPGVLFGGEGLHEEILPALPVAQIHGIDSITGVHGLEGAREWRRVHPVSSYLFSKFTRLFAHLLTKHPSSEIFERQEEAYKELGVVPALVLYRKSHEIDTPELRMMLQRAKTLSSPAV